MATGIFLIYGSMSHTTYSACRTYSARLHLPYVTYSDEPFTSLVDRDLLLLTKPSYVDAVAELIQVFGWRRIDYIYSNFEGLCFDN
ncbi:unnamed protein product [Lymnaea stagnalis]|uniref:Receptor ligand binding region domain-containing protein n=1 Tax=Lymnaea stagnalis TaxID=6523 RepID=A0AAV2IBG4_LYMST